MNFKKTLKKRENYGYRKLRELDLKDTYYYYCDSGVSMGRLINNFAKAVKELDAKQVKAFYLLNVENLVIKRPLEIILKRYKNYYDAGSITKGPFTPLTEIGFFKRALRRMFKYKSTERLLYKKVCVFEGNRDILNLLKERNSKLINKFSSKVQTYGKRFSIKQIIEKW